METRSGRKTTPNTEALQSPPPTASKSNPSNNDMSLRSQDEEELEYEEHQNLWRNEPMRPNDATPALRDHYVRHKNWEYGKGNGGVQDTDLWEQYQEDFEGWTEEHFKGVPNAKLRALRTTLREHGVLVSKKNRDTIAKALMSVLDEEKPGEWSREAIQEHIADAGAFQSKKINYIIKTGGSTVVFRQQPQ